MSSQPLILAIGDSLVAGHGLAPTESLPAQLERRLRAGHPSARVVNAGRSGDTTADVLRRLPPALSALGARPDLAIVQVGPNDVLRQLPSAATRANLDAILVEIGRCGVPVLLTIVDPPPMLRDHARAYLGIHETLAARHGARTCRFFPAGILGHPTMVLADRVHPNARAIGLVADAMAPVVGQALAAGYKGRMAAVPAAAG
ncbi:GDSL-type esterase/lipase family protein [uncultured Sphingomonas sp.]|uniref:GDSL-type esterase/lipase family protein n=1 Tax=uncultured Sphingomonas sp. TaxID=158754 RepID=UPI0025F28F3C|nr:GDSL-type esterase/lipase family protein [uncultured Sphingomonas sp.]